MKFVFLINLFCFNRFAAILIELLPTLQGSSLYDILARITINLNTSSLFQDVYIDAVNRYFREEFPENDPVMTSSSNFVSAVKRFDKILIGLVQTGASVNSFDVELNNNIRRVIVKVMTSPSSPTENGIITIFNYYRCNYLPFFLDFK